MEVLTLRKNLVTKNIIVHTWFRYVRHNLVRFSAHIPAPHQCRYLTVGTLVSMNFLKVIKNQGIHLEKWFFFDVKEYIE